MIWNKKSNIIIVCILSITYTIVTLLNIIGPLHINNTGNFNHLGMLSVYSIIYWIIALLVTWTTYWYLKRKPELLFFTLIILGIIIILIENFMWGLIGS